MTFANPPPIASPNLDEALQRLESFDPRKARIIEFTYFGGLTQEEAAQSLQLSVVTIHRELRLAKAWLERELATPPAP
jgi:RNA polymerase sigma factor (sigma-70 family)